MILHLAGGGGAMEAAEVASGEAEILAFARSVRKDVRSSLQMSVELLDEEADDPKPEEPEEEKPTVDDPDADDDDESDDLDPEKKPLPPKKLAERPKPKPPEKKPLPKPEKKEPPKKKELAEKKPEPKPKAKPPEKKEPPKEKKLAKKAPEKKPENKKEEPQKIELPKPDGRIAVINDPSLEKDQKDNPNARRIADEANTVKEESMARFRSYDQNTSKPNGGGEPEPTPAKEPGNAAETERGFSHEVPGEGAPRAGSEGGPKEPSQEPIARSQQGRNEPSAPGQKGRAAQKGVKSREAGTGPESPEAMAAEGAGSWSISPDPGGDGKKRQERRKGRKAIAGSPFKPGGPSVAGLSPRYSINAYGLQEALGKKHLRREQERARNTRIAKHRGRFKGNQFQKYRAAIENYDPSVKPGNQTSLNAAKVPFASYINRMHNRIHPIFGDGFLGGLQSLPPDDKLANLKLSAHAEIVVDGETGKVVRAGIVRTSGVTAFDTGAISSIHSAGPYGKAPDVIVSSDGNVYVHWEFYRDPYYACTSKFARPYVVNIEKKKPEAPPHRPSESDDGEKRSAKKGPLRPEKKKSE